MAEEGTVKSIIRESVGKVPLTKIGTFIKEDKGLKQYRTEMGAILVWKGRGRLIGGSLGGSDNRARAGS